MWRRAIGLNLGLISVHLAMTPREDRVTVIQVTVHRTETAVATAPIRFGAYVATSEGECAPDPACEQRGGIAKRPYGAGPREAYSIGDEVVVLTDGGVLADLSDGLRWAEVRQGRLVEPLQR